MHFISRITVKDYMQNEKDYAVAYQVQSSKHGETSENESQMNIETDVNLTKKKRIIFWAYLFAILCFAITVTVLAAKSWQATTAFTSTDSYYYAFQVAQDWKLGFIKDIVIVNGNTTNCPNGYETAVNYDWPGSSYGCYCNPSVNLSFVLEGYCSPGLIQDGCLNLKNQASFTTYNWKNYSRICIKRSPVSFFNQERYNGANKICGSSQSLVIVPTAQSCPFVNVSFTAFALQDHYSTVTDASNVLNPMYATFNSTSPYSFYSYPVIKFDVQEHEFCQMDLDLGISPSHSDYILLNIQRGCASQGNYTLLDSTTEIDFFQNNPSLQALTSIPGFPSPGNWQYLLGFHSLTGWTYQCRHNLNKKYSIPTASDQFSFTYLTTYKNFLVGVTVCLVVLLLQLAILTLRRIINSAVYPVGYKQRHLPDHFMAAMIRYVVDGAAKLTLLGLALVNIFTIYLNYNWFKGAVNERCADGNYATRFAILNPFMTLYTSLFNYALAVVVVCVAMIVIDLVHFVYIWRNQLNFYLLDTGDKQMVKREEEVSRDEYHFLEQKDVLEIKEIKDEKEDFLKDQNDQFRITMAQNIFAREDNVEVGGKLKKKKKKKVGAYKKKVEDDVFGDALEESNKIVEDEFNPYNMDDPMDMPDFSISPKAPSKTKRRKK